MTLYLTDNLPPTKSRAKDAGVVAVKLYPAGATTNSDAGVTDLRKTYKTLEAMQRAGLAAAGARRSHQSPDIDLFDREAVFIDTQLIPLRRDFPELKIVFEHITTQEARSMCRRGGPFHRCHHHRPPPAVQPQRHLHRRHSARTTTACPSQARNPPPGAGASRHQWLHPSSSWAPTAHRTPPT
jgi:hypothetical protein